MVPQSSAVENARNDVVEYARRMVAEGLVVGTSGNVSVRVGDLVAATPSGLDYSRMTPEDVPVVDLDGNLVMGSLAPTSELPMHLTCYRDFGAGAVVHTHSAAATALSLVRKEVPLVHYQMAMFGGQVRVSPYATFGTDELAINMSAALQGRSACILEHHGTVAFADSLGKAYDKVSQLEWLCDVWLRAQTAGQPAEISQEELAVCIEKFSTYGQAKSVLL